MHVRPGLIVLATVSGAEVLLAMPEMPPVWYGDRSGPAALRPGRDVVARRTTDGREVDRLWVDIARVTGTIVRRDRGEFLVDEGPHRGRVRLTIPTRALGRVQVRHPLLQPGFLLDVIGIRSTTGILGLFPATAQPTHPTLRSEHPTGPVRTAVPNGHILTGTVTWFDDGTAGNGAAYPAVDPWGDAGGCPGVAHGCAPLPYLSLGSEMDVRNDCTDRTSRVAVIECGCMAARFCDRCVHCDTSPRGRIAELTRADFVALGADLSRGCFNATVRVGE